MPSSPPGLGADLPVGRGQNTGPQAVAAPAQKVLVGSRPTHREVVR
jgi:hypothetical protein